MSPTETLPSPKKTVASPQSPRPFNRNSSPLSAKTSFSLKYFSSITQIVFYEIVENIQVLLGEETN